MRTHAEWKVLARSFTARFSEPQIDEIATRLEAAEKAGTPSCVWHEAAIVAGTTCWCADCEGQKKPVASRISS